MELVELRAACSEQTLKYFHENFEMFSENENYFATDLHSQQDAVDGNFVLEQE